MSQLHITLLSAFMAALINLWLAWRCGQARIAGKIAHGDGGDAMLARRMRAQANFIENTPIALVLILVLELAGQAGWLLGLSALAYFAARIAHAIGMEADKPGAARSAGIGVTFVLLFAWAIWAALAAFTVV